jgi:hypothetical protein
MLRVGKKVMTTNESLGSMSERQLKVYRNALQIGQSIIGRELPRYQLKIKDIDQELEWRAADPVKNPRS